MLGITARKEKILNTGRQLFQKYVQPIVDYRQLLAQEKMYGALSKWMAQKSLTWIILTIDG